jgi:membrane protein
MTHILKKIGLFLKRFLQKITLANSLAIKHELANHAGASALFFLLSIAPVVLLLVFLFDSYLVIYPEASESFFGMLTSLNENLDRDLLSEMGLLNIRGTAIGVFSLLSLVWAARLVMLAIQRGLGIIFPAKKARTPIMINVIAFMVVALLLLLIIVVVLINVGIDFFRRIAIDNEAAQSFVRSFLLYSGRLAPYLVSFCVIFLIYRFLPPRRPRTMPALTGAVLCTGAIALLQFVFSRFFPVTRYNYIYGLLGTLILTLVGVYFIFILFFLFAEFTYVSDRFDILMLERLYYFHRRRDSKGQKFEKFLFKEPDHLLRKYARAYQPEEILFREGDTGKEIFYNYRGQIGIYMSTTEGDSRIASVARGEIFGEMAYLLDETRTATAIADTESLLFVVTPDIFEELIRVNREVATDVIRILSDRLRKAHDYMLP